MSGLTQYDPHAFLEQAISIPSDEDVTEMREFLCETLKSQGIVPHVDEAGNTLATKGPAGGTPHLVLNTHIDTVTPHVPFERRRGAETEHRFHGRGACDAKGPLASLLAAFIAVEPTDARVTLAVTPDEETLSTGAATLSLDGDMYIVGEPTGLDVCTAAKGRYQGTVSIRGRAAHAAEPESGINSIATLENVLRAIRTFDEDDSPHQHLGLPSLTPTIVEGGSATNQIPAETTLVVDRRSIPPETADTFRNGLEQEIKTAVSRPVDISFTLTDRPSPFLQPFATDTTDPLVVSIQEVTERLGVQSEIRPFEAATEASYFAPKPVIVFGPGVLKDENGGVAHGPREYVPVSAVKQAADILTITVIELIE
jgi:acetylornithine deacetylase